MNHGTFSRRTSSEYYRGHSEGKNGFDAVLKNLLHLQQSKNLLTPVTFGTYPNYTLE